MLTFVWPPWPLKLGKDLLVSMFTLRNAWIILKLYRDILHIHQYLRRVWCWPCCDLCDISIWIKFNIPCYHNNYLWNTWILLKLYRDFHINISDEFDFDLSVTLLHFKLGKGQLTLLVATSFKIPSNHIFHNMYINLFSSLQVKYQPIKES